MPFFFKFLLLAVLFFSAQTAQSQKSNPNYITSATLPAVLQAEVIAIQDGDTIELKYIYTGKSAGRRMGKPLRLRFLHINCPERGRPYYSVAKKFTGDQCFRKRITVRHQGKFDKYGRLLAEIVLPSGQVLNKELVKRGLAVHFKKYSSDREYAALEERAKKQKAGLWSQPEAILRQSVNRL